MDFTARGRDLERRRNAWLDDAAKRADVAGWRRIVARGARDKSYGCFPRDDGTLAVKLGSVIAGFAVWRDAGREWYVEFTPPRLRSAGVRFVDDAATGRVTIDESGFAVAPAAVRVFRVVAPTDEGMMRLVRQYFVGAAGKPKLPFGPLGTEPQMGAAHRA